MTVELNDGLLMSMLAKGDMRPLGELYLRHGSMVKAALTRFAPEMARADIDELCQDVFLALNDSASRYVEQMVFKAWLYGIAVRKARAWRRKTWLRRKLLDKHIGQGVGMALSTNETPASRAELRDEIEAVLDRMSNKQREVVLLHAVDGFSGEEIAQILNVKVGVVWTRLYRACGKVAMAKRIENDEPAPLCEGES
ncbi:MAG: RNA polymerase sigma factor [Proteobacteria bacterium]|nr:RNA polymerase sigma factor [Pseudomonadota bacterium]